MSYLAACELPIACAVVYYGRVGAYLDQKPRCPVLYHYGSRGQEHPAQRRGRRSAPRYPQAAVYVYEGAGHGFNCDQRGSYDPQAAALARQRTLEFCARYLRGARRQLAQADGTEA